MIAAHSLGWASRCSNTNRTAFDRVYGSYLLEMTCTFPKKEVRIKRGTVQTAAADIEHIGSSLVAARSMAAARTTGVVAAAEDDHHSGPAGTATNGAGSGGGGSAVGGGGVACFVRTQTSTAVRGSRQSIPSIGTIALVGKNTSFSLDEHYSAFIEREVSAGRYRSASDVLRSALRLLEDRETQLEALREALATGERSGVSTPFDFDAFLAHKRAEHPRDG